MSSAILRMTLRPIIALAALAGAAILLARWQETGPQLRAALIGGSIAGLATALGALPVLLVEKIPPRAEGAILGFATGIMLAASAFSLIVPAIQAGSAIFGGRVFSALMASLGLAAGAGAIGMVERVLPHEHFNLQRHGPQSRMRRIWLLVFAILIHNVPEGMAIGVAFSGEDISAGIPVAAAIAIQDVPEGLVVALALRVMGYRPALAALTGAASGLAEPLGAGAASAVLTLAPSLYPLGLAFAAGMMLFVVIHEMIPGTRRGGRQMAATLGIFGGFIVMMFLDNAFA